MISRERVGVVVPCYNSENSIIELIRRAETVLNDLNYEAEIVLANDGSSDNTLDVLKKQTAHDPQIKVVDLSKNFGQHSALLAAIHNLSAVDYVIGIDDDLQTPPEEIGKLFQALQNSGSDVVFGLPDRRQYQIYRSLGSRFNRWCACLLTDRPKHSMTSSFWLARGYIAEEIKKRRDPLPQIQAIIFEITNRVAICDVVHNPREYGKSGYTMGKLVRQWARLLHYSDYPQRILCRIMPAIFIAGAISLALGIAFPDKAVCGFAIWSLLTGAMLSFAALVVSSYSSWSYKIARGVPPYVVRNVFFGKRKL